MQRDTILHAPIPHLYRLFLFPTLIAMTSNSLYCLADVFFIAQGSGSMGLAALNIAMPVFTIFSCVGLIFGVGGATVMSVAEGGNHPHQRNQAFTISMVAMSVIGLLMTFGFTIFWEPLAYAFGGTQELMSEIKGYMIPINICSLFYILMYAGSVILRNDHAPGLAMKATLAGNILNIFLDWLFVMVFHMGISGAAIATSLSTMVGVGIMASHFVRKQNTVRFVPDVMQKDIWIRVIKSGFGSGILEFTCSIITVVFNFVILRYADTSYLAAFAIITNIAFVCKGMLNGFGQGAQPIIAANHGAGQHERVQQILSIALRSSMLFALVLYLIFLIVPQSLAAIFASGNATVIAYATTGIRFYFAGLICMAAMNVILYYFQSVEQGNLSSALAVCKGFVFVMIWLFLLLSIVGIQGIWFAVPLAETTALLGAVVIMKKASFT